MTKKESHLIFEYLKEGYIFSTGGEHEWGMEYHVPDVLLWKKDASGARTEVLLTRDKTMHYLRQFDFGLIKIKLKNLF